MQQRHVQGQRLPPRAEFASEDGRNTRNAVSKRNEETIASLWKNDTGTLQ